MLEFNLCFCTKKKKDRESPIPNVITLPKGKAAFGPLGGWNTHYGPVGPGGGGPGPIGAGGCGPCVAIVIKCPGGIAVYHFTGGDDAYNELRNQDWSGCDAIVCGGNDSPESNCLADEVLRGASHGGINVVGVSGRDACGVTPGGGWYVGE